MSQICPVLLCLELKAFAHPTTIHGAKYKRWLQRQLDSIPMEARQK